MATREDGAMNEAAMASAEDGAIKEAARKQYWLPLESNPEVLNEFATKIGSQGAFAFHDVFGLDPELLAMVPRPCIAVTLLFPSDAMKPAKAEQLRKLSEEDYKPDDGIFFMRQYVGNACGTIAAVHALANNSFVLGSDSGLAQFVAQNTNLTPEDRGANLARAKFISQATEASAQEGQTATPGLGDEVNHHFITFVNIGGVVYELDGAKPYPINHGPVGEDLLAAVAEVIKREFIAHVPDGMFNVMALAHAESSRAQTGAESLPQRPSKLSKRRMATAVPGLGASECRSLRALQPSDLTSHCWAR
eukprot:CAMPEP_0206050276 /NCGR_PEP_ID=MMETSP1466-20131121/28807_1 /ASSEMBLY_ACC=CAM_ASM_001126 /TAXON_ID=44452 /ORGANISM="Pavlova gyrans, Strain CCMP608" /LENGTH=305 /DNA_ID=CAMNT_0053425387 /DNA_START=48 /DNA_END=966 /DNA_ORIENTATION=-